MPHPSEHSVESNIQPSKFGCNVYTERNFCARLFRFEFGFRREENYAIQICMRIADIMFA